MPPAGPRWHRMGSEVAYRGEMGIDYIGAFAASRLQRTFFTAGGFHVPSPGGRIEGASRILPSQGND